MGVGVNALWGSVCHSTHVDVRSQFILPPLCGFRGSNSGWRAGGQCLYPLSHRTNSSVVFLLV